MHFAGKLSPAQFWAHVAQMEDTIRAGFGAFPVYALAAWSGPRMLAEWGSENDVLTTAGLLFGDPDSSYAHVQTTRTDPFEVALTARFAAGGPPTSGEDVRNRRHALSEAPTTTRTIRVDDVPVEFTCWDTTGTWYAAAAHGPLGLVLDSKHLDPATFALTRLDDIEPYLAGRRAHLRLRRGE